MSVRSGFFNSLVTKVDGVDTYDREYYAADFANYLVKVVGNGVFAKPSNNLQILASTGMNVVVKAGEGRIDGYWVNNESDYTLTIDQADVILNRIDRIVMQLNAETRKISIVYKAGTLATNPVAPELVRTEQIKEYSLARISVPKGTTTIYQSNITDTRPLEDECGLIATMGEMESNNYFIQMQSFVDNFIATKSSEYNTWEETQQAAFDTWFAQTKETVKATSLYREYQAVYTSQTKGEQVITIPTSINYVHNSLDVLNVFVNGMRLLKNVEYTINTNGTQISLTYGLDVVGTDVEFVNKKSVEDAVAENVVVQVEKLQDEVDSLADCTYIATGTNDNNKLSTIVKNFLNGTGDYSGVADNASMSIKVTGLLNIGNLIDNQVMFDFQSNDPSASNRRIFIDFGNATIPVLATTSTKKSIFTVISANEDVVIQNANIKVLNYNATTIYGIHGGVIDNCKIYIDNQTATNTYAIWGANKVSNTKIQVNVTNNGYGIYGCKDCLTNWIKVISDSDNQVSIDAGQETIAIGNRIFPSITISGSDVKDIGNIDLSIG